MRGSVGSGHDLSVPSQLAQPRRRALSGGRPDHYLVRRLLWIRRSQLPHAPCFHPGGTSATDDISSGVLQIVRGVAEAGGDLTL
jgi:hypothetical protein